MNSHNFENEREVYVCTCQLRDRFLFNPFLGTDTNSIAKAWNAKSWNWSWCLNSIAKAWNAKSWIEVDVLIQLPRPGTPSLGVEFYVIQLPRPGMPSPGIEVDVLIQLPRPGTPSLGIEVDVLIQLPRPGTPSLGIEFDVIQLPRPGMPSLGIEAHYFRGYDALVQG